jgi:hypothetical protein
MKHWTPQEIACVILIGSVCLIMIAMEGGIVFRSTAGDVADSRQLLSHMTDIVIGLTAGFFMGKSKQKED